MASPKLHIEGSSKRPVIIKNYLDFIDRRGYDSLDAVMSDIYRETGVEVGDTKGLLVTLSRLGIVESNNRQSLTELGRSLVDVLIYDEELFYELFHFRYATAFHRDTCKDKSISWSYYTITEELHKRTPTDFGDKKRAIVETVNQRADRSEYAALTNHGPVSGRSLSGYRGFINHLEPTIVDSDNLVTLRDLPKREVVLAAIDHVYRTDVVSSTINYGNPLSIDAAADTLQTLLFAPENKLTEIIEHVAGMDGRLELMSDYELKVRLRNEVNISDFA